MNESLFNWSVLILSAACNALGVFIIKLGLNRQGPVSYASMGQVVRYFVNLIKSPLVLVGVGLFFLAPFLFAIALSRMEMSVAQPAQVGLNFSILMLCAVFFLKESFTARKALGVGLVVLGLICLHVG